MIKSLFDQAEEVRCMIAAAEKRGERIGLERSEKRGEKKGRLAVARELVKLGKLSLEEIASCTYLTLDEIEKLA